ncbi:MAG: hypothetical protein AB1696_27580 [Planctomycetota bacterium]
MSNGPMDYLGIIVPDETGAILLSICRSVRRNWKIVAAGVAVLVYGALLVFLTVMAKEAQDGVVRAAYIQAIVTAVLTGALVAITVIYVWHTGGIARETSELAKATRDELNLLLEDRKDRIRLVHQKILWETSVFDEIRDNSTEGMAEHRIANRELPFQDVKYNGIKDNLAELPPKMQAKLRKVYRKAGFFNAQRGTTQSQSLCEGEIKLIKSFKQLYGDLNDIIWQGVFGDKDAG